jgi:inorganic pyrophosphatase
MDLIKIGAGEKAPQEINVVVEIPQGSGVKYEFDEKMDAIEVDRFIGSASVYPFNYGFIPLTLADDGDALDVMVLSSMAVAPGSVISCRPIGLLEMEDEHGIDTKILAVPNNGVDPFYDHIEKLEDVDIPTRERIKLFFKQYKEMEVGRWSKVSNFGGRKEALVTVKEAIEKFKKDGAKDR